MKMLLHCGYPPVVCRQYCDLVLITVLVRDVILVKLKIEERLIDMMAIFLFFTILFYTFSSYGFLFSIERGIMTALR